MEVVHISISRMLLLTVCTLVVGCDTAKAGYLECESLERKGDVSAARDACEKAAEKAPTSKFGILAANKAEQLRSSEKASLEAKARDQQKALDKWKDDLNAGRIDAGTRPPGSGRRPDGKCDCKPGDVLCSCL